VVVVDASAAEWAASRVRVDRRQVARSIRGAEELRDAIDQGQLINHYQPTVSLATGKLIGVEALVRWRHPAAGLVFPDQFTGVAEAHGLIDKLTQVVLAAGLEQASVWRKTISVAVISECIHAESEFVGVPRYCRDSCYRERRSA
jgi:sensor c-di-GMP phosphodiesterase-like protein